MAVKAKRSACRIASSSTSLIARHSSTRATPLRGEKNFPVSVMPDRPRPERLNISRSSPIGSDGTSRKRRSFTAARILRRSVSYTPCPTCLPFSP